MRKVDWIKFPLQKDYEAHVYGVSPSSEQEIRRKGEKGLLYQRNHCKNAGSDSSSSKVQGEEEVFKELRTSRAISDDEHNCQLW